MYILFIIRFSLFNKVEFFCEENVKLKLIFKGLDFMVRVNRWFDGIIWLYEYLWMFFGLMLVV